MNAPMARLLQRGWRLLTALALLLSLALLGVAWLQARAPLPSPAGDPAARQLALEAAEAALRAGEAWLAEPAHQAQAERGAPLANPASWDGRDPPATGIAGACRDRRLASPPVFHVGPPRLARLGVELPASYRRIYPVTARSGAVPKDDEEPGSAAVVLQSMFEPRRPQETIRLPTAAAGPPVATPAAAGERAPAPILRLCNGVSAALVGNGADGQGHTAVLFIIAADTGAVLQAIDTDVGTTQRPNRLAAPAVTDWPAGDQRARRAYAGDSLGNLWRFNLPCGPAQGLTDSAAHRLFKAEDADGAPQPIRTQPAIAQHPKHPGQLVIAFATGGARQNGAQAAHASLYAIFDTADPQPPGGLSRADLQSRSVQPQGSEALRNTPRPTPIPSASDLDPHLHRGWSRDLDACDPEQATNPLILVHGESAPRVRVLTRTPNWNLGHNIAPCFVVELDLATGGHTGSKACETDRHGPREDHDRTSGQPDTGIGPIDGDCNPSRRTQIGRQENLYTGGDGNIRALTAAHAGRRSWRQLR